MKIIFLFFFTFVLACEKPKTETISKPVVPTKMAKPTKPTKPTVEKKVVNSKPFLDPELAKVHEALRTGKKISAIKEHRKLHRLPLHVGKQAVEIEQTKLGLPSLATARTLVWDGKDIEAIAHLQLVFRSLNESSAIGRLQQMKKALGPATEENLAAHIKNGKLKEAMKVYRYLHPDVEVPEIYKLLWEKMPNKVKY